LVTIDLKDGFHHVPVNDDSVGYLGFEWKKVIYTWNVCPFGLSCSPYFFVKTLRPCIEYFRQQGIRLLCYMDDILIAASPENIIAHRDLVLSVLQGLGWHVNFEKSSLEVKTCTEYLGYIVDSVGKTNVPEIRVPNYKLKKLSKDIRRALDKKTITARHLARIIGQCSAMCRAIFPGKLQLRNAYRLLRSKLNWESTLYWTDSVIQDLKWWMTALHSWNGVAIIGSPVDLQVETDASGIGWGVSFGDKKAQGLWTKHLAYQSSNYRELFTVLMALKTFKEEFRGKNIQILSDNVTTVAYLNHMGGPYKDLTDLARVIWLECLQNRTNIVSRHLRGLLNTRADHLSRLIDKFEWRLHPRLFRMLDVMWGPHTIDRFASLTTTHLARYNSRYCDPNSVGVDALAQKDWHTNNNYVNPPFRLIPEVLKVAKEQKALVTIIAPWWPAQPWFQELRRLSIRPPVRLPNTWRSVLPMTTLIVPEPLLNRKWKLYAWRIDGKPD
jgi:ribonuclease HI